MTDIVYVMSADIDRKYLQILMERCNNENILNDEYRYFDTLPYKSVPPGNQMWYIEMINRFPDQDDPELFGMYPGIVAEQDNLESQFFLSLIYQLTEKRDHKSELTYYSLIHHKSLP